VSRCLVMSKQIRKFYRRCGAPGSASVRSLFNLTVPATVRRYHCDSHDQLRAHVADFLAAYNFARRLKTLNGLTPYEYICKIWTSEPARFILDPIHQMPGLNS